MSGAASRAESIRTTSPGVTAVEYSTRTLASRSTRGSATDAALDDLEGGLGQEPAVLPDQLPVGVHLAVATEVADHVPVEARRVLASGLGEAGAQREVHRPADLLVEEDVAGEAVDLVVQPERDLAEDAGSCVHVEQRLEVRVPARRLGCDDAPLLEAQADVLHLAAVVHGGERVADLPFRAGLDRAREDLAVGHVVAAVRGEPRAPRDLHPEVGVGALDPQLPRRGECRRA